jgi:hypothetical protein
MNIENVWSFGGGGGIPQEEHAAHHSDGANIDPFGATTSSSSSRGIDTSL